MPSVNEFTKFITFALGEHIPINIPKFHVELHNLIEHKRIAIAAPRSFAKSYTYSFFYPLYKALKPEKQDILLISATATLAELWLRRIKRELEENQTIRNIFGNQVSDKWTESEITLRNGSRIVAKGAGCQVRGFRYSVIVCDDLENDESVRSEDQREKLADWFWKALVNTLEPESQLIVIGTILHPFSFLRELIAGRDGWVVRCFKAIEQDTGELLWEAKWSKEKLEQRKKEIGSIAFASEFLNTPIQEASQPFKLDDIEFYDEKPEAGVCYITVDPAISEKDTADYTAIVVANRTKDNGICVLDYSYKRQLPSETIKTILDMAKMYEPFQIGIETVAYQKALVYSLQEEMQRRGEYYTVEEIKPDRDKFRRIIGLQPYVENHKLVIHKDMKELKEMLVCYPACKHDDLLDALAMQLVLNRPNRTEPEIEHIAYYAQDRVSGY